MAEPVLITCHGWTAQKPTEAIPPSRLNQESQIYPLSNMLEEPMNRFVHFPFIAVAIFVFLASTGASAEYKDATITKIDDLSGVISLTYKGGEETKKADLQFFNDTRYYDVDGKEIKDPNAVNKVMQVGNQVEVSTSKKKIKGFEVPIKMKLIKSGSAK